MENHGGGRGAKKAHRVLEQFFRKFNILLSLAQVKSEQISSVRLRIRTLLVSPQGDVSGNKYVPNRDRAGIFRPTNVKVISGRTIIPYGPAIFI